MVAPKRKECFVQFLPLLMLIRSIKRTDIPSSKTNFLNGLLAPYFLWNAERSGIITNIGNRILMTTAPSKLHILNLVLVFGISVRCTVSIFRLVHCAVCKVKKFPEQYERKLSFARNRMPNY